MPDATLGAVWGDDEAIDVGAKASMSVQVRDGKNPNKTTFCGVAVSPGDSVEGFVKRLRVFADHVERGETLMPNLPDYDAEEE